VFYTNMRLYELGQKRVVWPITLTTHDAWDLWGQMAPDEVRLAVPSTLCVPDADAEVFLEWLGPLVMSDLEVVEKRGACWVFEPRVVAALRRPAAEGDAVLAAWHSGFYSEQEHPGGRKVRWCRQSGKLTLSNPSNRPRTVTLRWKASAAVPVPASVWIDGQDFRDRVPLDDRVYRRTLTVPPRSLRTLTFTSDGPRGSIPGDLARKPHFGLAEIELSDAPGQPTPGSARAAGPRVP
jgi:hypothetical protein